MKLAVSTYSFARLKYLPIRAIKAAKQLGFTAVEVVATDKIPAFFRKRYYARVKKTAEKCGVTIAAFLFGADFLKKGTVETVKRQIDLAAVLGVKLVRHDVTSGPKDGRTFDDILPALASGIREVCNYAKARGIVTTVENHGFYFQDIDKEKKLLEAVGSDNFRLLGDMGNYYCGDVDPAKAFGALAPYMAHVHAKDFFVSEKDNGGFRSRGGKYLKGTVIGKGDVDVPACIASLKQAGYQGYISIEFEGSEPVLQSIREGKEYLEKLI